MMVFAQAFFIPKSGNTDTEYEDAFWPKRKLGGCFETFTFACSVADGATETSYSKAWANQIARAICRKEIFEQQLFLEYLPRLQDKWHKYVRRRTRSKSTPWFLEEKIKSGAAASVIGLHIKHAGVSNRSNGIWTAIAVGDSCLAQVSQDRLVDLFPISQSADFNNRPYLVSSNVVHNEHLKDNVREVCGSWTIDDEFYLMTDAFAHWFAKSVENGQAPWRTLRVLDTADQRQPFHEWIRTLRMTGEMRNDDVTLLRVNLV